MTKGLTRETIVDAAFGVLDDRGMEGLTVRALAERLGVKAPALYWHVRDKQELLDEMGTRVWTGIARVSSEVRTDGDWRGALARYARAARHGLLAHRDGARAFSGTYLTDPEVLRDQEAGLAWMESQGFPVRATADAYAIITGFVVGHCIEEQARSQSTDDRYSIAVRDERVGSESHPRVAASGRSMFARDPETVFEAHLAVVLDGVAGLRSESGPAAG